MPCSSPRCLLVPIAVIATLRKRVAATGPAAKSHCITPVTAPTNYAETAETGRALSLCDLPTPACAQPAISVPIRRGTRLEHPPSQAHEAPARPAPARRRRLRPPPGAAARICPRPICRRTKRAWQHPSPRSKHPRSSWSRRARRPAASPKTWPTAASSSDARLFEAFVRVNGLAGQLEAGTFQLSPHMTIPADRLRAHRRAGRRDRGAGARGLALRADGGLSDRRTRRSTASEYRQRAAQGVLTGLDTSTYAEFLDQRPAGRDPRRLPCARHLPAARRRRNHAGPAEAAARYVPRPGDAAVARSAGGGQDAAHAAPGADAGQHRGARGRGRRRAPRRSPPCT